MQRVSVLGVTGPGGWKLVSHISNFEPQCEITLGGVDSAGMTYDVALSTIDVDYPKQLQYPQPKKEILRSRIKKLNKILENTRKGDWVFSCLRDEGDLAKTMEPEFAMRGAKVYSITSAYREHDHNPLYLPGVNDDHLELLRIQQRDDEWAKNGGYILAKGNCTSIIISYMLAPFRAFGIKKVAVTAELALSGAGLPGLSKSHRYRKEVFDAPNRKLENKKEIDKLEREPRKMLGKFVGDKIENAPFLPHVVEVYRTGNRENVHGLRLLIQTEENPLLADVRSKIDDLDGRVVEDDAPLESLVELYGPLKVQLRVERLGPNKYLASGGGDNTGLGAAIGAWDAARAAAAAGY